MKIMLKIMPLLVIVLLTAQCANGNGNEVLPPSDGTPPNNNPPEGSVTVTYDFDTGSPALAPQMSNTPLEQTVGGVTAHFSSPWDPAAYSIQNQDTTFFVLPQFSGNYLYQNESSRIKLRIDFGQTLISITMTFATIEYHGVGEVDQPTAIELTAYLDSTGTPAVGSATARGVFPEGYTYPEGTLSFDSGGQPFNIVEIELLYQQRGATNFLIDKVVVSTSP
jgi:hypothetical protein